MPPFRHFHVWGLLEYRPQWTLTLKGWGIILLTLGLLISVILLYLQPFLAMTERINAQALVVEGWIDEDGMGQAKKEFEQGNYQVLITTGEEVGAGSVFAQYHSYAQLAAVTFQNLGVDAQKIVAIPNPKVRKDRTAASAQAVKNWILQSALPITAINLYSYDVHSRRSWFIYYKILQPELQVGILHFPSPYYNPQFWWLYSEGVRSVLSEAIAYLYALLVWQFTL